MPLHDWTRVLAGTFHDFRLSWMTALAKELNHGILPSEYYAIKERHPQDYLTGDEAPTEDYLREFSEEEAYAVQQNSLVIRHASGDRIVALIEIMSPGNKSSAGQLESLIRKLSSALHHGIHVLVIDLFPPGPYDPQGIHATFCHFGQGAQFQLPHDKQRTLVAYEASTKPRAYVEPVGLAQELPPMPLFLEAGWYVNLPLEPSYLEAFAAVPERWRSVIEG